LCRLLLLTCCGHWEPCRQRLLLLSLLPWLELPAWVKGTPDLAWVPHLLLLAVPYC
jgi:hypothetical protein